jgi:hypothetical protein
MSIMITKWFIIATVIIWIIYDIVAYNIWGVDSTISRVVINTVELWPAIAFGAGFVAGHLFWPQKIEGTYVRPRE